MFLTLSYCFATKYANIIYVYELPGELSKYNKTILQRRILISFVIKNSQGNMEKLQFDEFQRQFPWCQRQFPWFQVPSS